MAFFSAGRCALGFQLPKNHLSLLLRRFASGVGALAFRSILSHRSVLRLEGADTAKFLQGQLTNDVELLQSQPILYAFILNAQGRVLHDVFLYKGIGQQDTFFLETDKGEMPALLSRLKFYKLRSKVTISEHPGVVVCDINKPTATTTTDGPAAAAVAGGKDPRFKANISPSVQTLSRFVLPSTDVSFHAGVSELSLPQYHRLRIRAGIAEGPADLPPGTALPLEANLEELNGVSWTKGCYVGQELTARTHYTGVIRKRVLPVRIGDTDTDTDQVPPMKLNAPLEGTGATRPGRLLSQAGRYGLALVNIDATDLQASDEYGMMHRVTVEWPAWLSHAKKP
eukprot:m.238469 g.238469  ORF g.238469 m.238469 type:complete len:340 (-) comp21805_c0_seq1:29-1048(-)